MIEQRHSYGMPSTNELKREHLNKHYRIGALGRQERSILVMLEHAGETMTRNELSARLVMRVASVCGRCKSLLDAGLIEVAGTKKCAETARSVQALRLTLKGENWLDASRKAA